VEFKEHEVKFCERIRGLERDVEIRDNKIEYLKNELDSPSPPAQIYSPPKKDLSWTCLPEFVDDTVTDYSRPTPSIDASKCNKSELQKEFARENQRLSEQLARDFEITRLHAEEELKIMIEGLDKSNEVVAKHLRE
nr:hypothetical protein [Tanacetum cinerariifolium]